MKDLFIRLWKYLKGAIGNQIITPLNRTYTGRILNALKFSSIIFFLGLWIIAFLFLKDDLLTESLPNNLLTDLSCLSFFGGLVLAIIIGALAGNFLQRVFWKKWIQKKKN